MQSPCKLKPQQELPCLGLVFHSVLRHRDKELDGTTVKEYLVTCRENGNTVDKWFPGTVLDSALVAEYWSTLAQRQLAGVQKSVPPGFPLPHQIPHSADTGGLDVLGIGRRDALPLRGGGVAGGQ